MLILRPSARCNAERKSLFTLSNSFDNRGVLIWPPAALSLVFRYCEIFLWRALQYWRYHWLVVIASSSSSSSSSFGRVPYFQMLAVMVLSQHRVSTFKTVSPRIPVGARCTGHVRIICSAVCSAAPHSQFDVGSRPHLCMNH